MLFLWIYFGYYVGIFEKYCHIRHVLYDMLLYSQYARNTAAYGHRTSELHADRPLQPPRVYYGSRTGNVRRPGSPGRQITHEPTDGVMGETRYVCTQPQAPRPSDGCPVSERGSAGDGR